MRDSTDRCVTRKPMDRMGRRHQQYYSVSSAYVLDLLRERTLPNLISSALDGVAYKTDIRTFCGTVDIIVL